MSIPRNIARRIIDELKKLQDIPIPRYAVKIRGEKEVYRIRIGSIVFYIRSCGAMKLSLYLEFPIEEEPMGNELANYIEPIFIFVESTISMELIEG